MNDHSIVGVITLYCTECGRRWDDRRDRWRAYLTDEEPHEMFVYCDDCAEREFGR